MFQQHSLLLQSLSLIKTIKSIQNWTDFQGTYLKQNPLLLISEFSKLLPKIFCGFIFKGAGSHIPFGTTYMNFYYVPPWHIYFCMHICIYTCLYVCMYSFTHSSYVYVRPKMYTVDIVVGKSDEWMLWRWMNEYCFTMEAENTKVSLVLHGYMTMFGEAS